MDIIDLVGRRWEFASIIWFEVIKLVSKCLLKCEYFIDVSKIRLKPTYQKEGINPYHVSWLAMINTRRMGTFTLVYKHQCLLLIFFCFSFLFQEDIHLKFKLLEVIDNSIAKWSLFWTNLPSFEVESHCETLMSSTLKVFLSLHVWNTCRIHLHVAIPNYLCRTCSNYNLTPFIKRTSNSLNILTLLKIWGSICDIISALGCKQMLKCDVDHQCQHITLLSPSQ